MAEKSTKKRSWLKIFAIVFGVMLVSFLALAIILPLVIQIDQYRPQIEQVVNDQINGSLKIGKLSLSLWGKVEIDIQDVSLKDKNTQELVAFKQAYVLIPFSAIMLGSPKLNFKLEKPKIVVKKDAKGNLNLLSLVKPSTAAPTEPAAQTSEAPKETASNDVSPGQIPGLAFIAASKIYIDLVDADLEYMDEASKVSQTVKNLDVSLHDVSMTSTTKFLASAEIETKVGALLSLKGPFEIKSHITPKFEGIQFQKADIDFEFDTSKMDVMLPGLLHKKPGLPMGFSFKSDVSLKDVVVKDLKLKFHNAVLNADAKVSDLQAKAPQTAADPEILFDLKSQSIDLAPWNEVLVPLAAYKVQGSLLVGANANGKLSNLGYGATVNAKDFSAELPGLNVKPNIQLDVEVITNELKKAWVSVTAPETDVSVLATIKDFAKPQIAVNVDSKSLNLDKLLPPPAPVKPGEKPADGAAPQGTQAPTGGASNVAGAPAAPQNAPVVDVDGMLKPVRENEALKGMRVDFKVRMAKIVGMNQNISDLKLDFLLKDLVASVESFSMQIFKGKISNTASIDIKPERPQYKLGLNVEGIDLQNAIETNVPSLKNTMIGTLSMKAQGNGQSLNSDLLMKNLKLNGDFKLADGKFATVDVSQMLTEGVNGSLDKIAAKVPGLGDKKLKTPPNKNMKFKQVSSSFSLSDGVLKAPDFFAEALPGESIDIRGNTVLGLLEDSMQAEWNLVDTHNLTKLQDVNVQSNGITVERVLAKQGQPVQFPIIVGCKLSAPCYKYDAIPEHFTKIALENISNAVKGKAQALLKEQEAKIRAQAEALKKEQEEKLKQAQEKARKEAEEKAKQQVGDKVKDKLKGLKF